MPFLQRLDDPLLLTLYRYWDGRRGRAFAPPRAAIDPVDIPRLLPHLMLTEILLDAEGHRRYRYRLAGTDIERHFGCTMGGRWIDELMQEPYRRYVLDLYERLVATRRPVYSQSIYGRLGRARSAGMVTKRLMLPLSADGETIDMVLSGQTFRAQEEHSVTSTVLDVQTDFDPELQE